MKKERKYKDGKKYHPPGHKRNGYKISCQHQQ
jgi:hypothetical protein